jgi:S1-C subfamily serine protease
MTRLAARLTACSVARFGFRRLLALAVGGGLSFSLPAATHAATCGGNARGGDAVVITLAAPGGQLAHGAGVVWDDRGRIITNHHVAAAGNAPLITYADGRRVAARVLAVSPRDDVAVLVPLSGGLARGTDDPLPMGQATPGQPVVAWGNPGGRGLARSDGRVNGLGRLVNSGGLLLPDMIETSVPLIPGNSGGPMFDCAGRFIGLAAAAVLTPQGTQAGFAIPAARVAQVAARLLAETRTAEASLPAGKTTVAASSASVAAAAVAAPPVPRLGVMVRPAAEGLLVTEVSPGLAGARAGLRVGDVLRAAERRPLAQPQDVAAVLRDAAGQGWAQVELNRDGRLLAVMVEVKV